MAAARDALARSARRASRKPAKKAARYLQIENEARVLVKYDLAKTVPLVE